MHAATVSAYDAKARMSEQFLARDAISLRLGELLDAAADYDALFDNLGYSDAEGLMLAAQKLAERARVQADADPLLKKKPATSPAEITIQSMQDEIDQLRRQVNE